MSSFRYWRIPGMDANRTRSIVGRLARAYGRHPLMRAFVVGRVLRPAGIAPRDTAGTVAAIFRWVRDNIRFQNEPGEQVLTPGRVLIWRFGDCDDRAGLVAAMLESVGIRWRLVLLSRHGTPFHIWPQALVRGRWMHLETSDDRARLGESPESLMGRTAVRL